MLSQWMFLSILVITLTSCSVVKGTVNGVAAVGNVTGKVVKTTGAVAYHTGNAVYKTGKTTSHVVRTAVYTVKGKQIIPLEKEGNSLYVTAHLGRRKVPARLLIDTGASATQITAQLARRLRLDPNRGERIPVKLADGRMVSAREVIIPQIQLRGVRVSHVRALVFEQQIPGQKDGLLGMSFLDHFIFQIDADKPELVLQQKAK